MTLREAKDIVKAIAGERYHNAAVKLAEGSTQLVESYTSGVSIPEYLQCEVYIENVGTFYGESFTAALDNLQTAMRDMGTRIEELQAGDANV